MLAEIERGRRNRRTIDAVLLVVAAIVAGLTAVVAQSAAEYDADVAQALVDSARMGRLACGGPRSSECSGSRSSSSSTCCGAGAGASPATCSSRLLFVVGLTRRPRVGSSSPTGSLLTITCYRAGVIPSSGSRRRPAILVVAGPELVRWGSRARHLVVPFATFGRGRARRRAPVRARLPRWRSASARERSSGSRSARRQACRRPRECVAALATLGVHVSDLRPAERQRVGYAEYVGHDAAGAR